MPEKTKETKKTEGKGKPEKAGKVEKGVEKVEKAKEPEKAKPEAAAPAEKKAEKKKAEKKPKKKRPGVFSHYKVENEGFKRLLPFCERCGSGYFMGDHGNRFTCGHCGFTRFKSVESQPSK